MKEKITDTNSPYEYSIGEHNKMRTKIGFNSKENPKIAYMSVKAKLVPSKKKPTYTDDVANIRKQFTSLVKTSVWNDKYFSDKYILNLELGEKYINSYNTSFIRFDVYVRPKDIENKLERHEKEIKRLSNELNNGLGNILARNNFTLR